jgi:hypothetical protein
MDPHKRPRSHTTPENGQCITVEHDKFLNSVSNETDTNNQTSFPSGTKKSFFIFIKNSFYYSRITNFSE